MADCAGSHQKGKITNRRRMSGKRLVERSVRKDKMNHEIEEKITIPAEARTLLILGITRQREKR